MRLGLILMWLMAAGVARGQIVTLSATAAATAAPDVAQTVVITDRGFRSPRIDIRAAMVGMVIQNRSHLQNLTVEMVQEGKTAVALTSQHTATQADNVFIFTAAPGTYVLSVAGHPAWTCVLNVAAK